MNNTGEILKYLRTSRGLGQQKIANLVGAKSYTTVSKWENGENYPQGRDLKILSEFFGVSSDYILGIDQLTLTAGDASDYGYYPEPLSAGLPNEVDAITEVEKITIPDALMGKHAGNSDIYITRVNGESMNRIIPDQSLIAVKPIETHELKNNDIVVYQNGAEYAVKRYFKFDDEVVFRPDSYDERFREDTIPINDANELMVKGKVVMWIVTSD